MKTEGDLFSFYSQKLSADLADLESQRKKIVTKVIVLSAAVFLFWGASGLLLLFIAPPLVILSVFFFMSVWGVGYHLLTQGYRQQFKESVVRKLIRFIDENLAYSPSQGIKQETFMRSRIFTIYPDRYASDDYVSGTVGKTAIAFSDVHAQQRTETRDSRGRRYVTYTTIFKGVFFVADFNKNFKGTTLVLPDTAQRLLGTVLGSALQSHNFARPPLVKLEDPEFEKMFVVYGDDQIEARYILSTSMMARIAEFKKKSKKDIYLSFVDDKVMMAIPYSKDMFEPHILKSLLDFGTLDEYFDNIQIIVGLVEDLNLNTRIWGKQ
ncbi:Uncharacterised protein [uncultured archaeon]|nr:Uncharacterised protein [uncultured archaeon]